MAVEVSPCFDQVDPVAAMAPIFKMRRTHKEFSVARKLLRQDAIISKNDEGTALTTERALDTAKEIVKAASWSCDNGNKVANSLLDSMCKPSGGLLKQKPKALNEMPPTFVVSHPWNIIDYHLYLCFLEKHRDAQERQNSMYVFDGDECRRFMYDEFLVDRNLKICCPPDKRDVRRLLFCSMPLPERTHLGDRGPAFNGQFYVLGFDFVDRIFYARHFRWLPNHTDDLWCVWDEGVDVYTLSIQDLISVIQSTIDNGRLHAGTGILSSSPNCNSLTSTDDPGLEIVIVITFCQWLLDFEAVLFDHTVLSMEGFKDCLTRCHEGLRLILQRASYRAWFAARDGSTEKRYKHSSIVNQYINDLYTYDKSVEVGSLKGVDWAPPCMETCGLIREEYRRKQKEQNERRLMDLFIPPGTEPANENPVVEKPEQEYAAMLASSGNSFPICSSLPSIFSTKPPPSAVNPLAKPPFELPRTPSPKPQRTPPLSDHSLSPGSPGIVTPAIERYDEFEVTEYHKVPLSILLRRTLDLVEARPELDTGVNRGRFGDLLSSIGIGIQHPPIQDTDIDLPPLEYENDTWKLEIESIGSGAFIRRLLPSPTF